MGAWCGPARRLAGPLHSVDLRAKDAPACLRQQCDHFRGVCRGVRQSGISASTPDSVGRVGRRRPMPGLAERALSTCRLFAAAFSLAALRGRLFLLSAFDDPRCFRCRHLTTALHRRSFAVSDAGTTGDATGRSVWSGPWVGQVAFFADALGSAALEFSAARRSSQAAFLRARRKRSRRRARGSWGVDMRRFLADPDPDVAAKDGARAPKRSSRRPCYDAWRSSSCPRRGAADETCFLAVGRSLSYVF